MRISIITPCFNAAHYLPDCIASVRHALQGYDYEHIIIDAGSQDGTLEILKQNKDLNWTSEPDGGMYEALNKGVARASGDVIGHLNSDEQYDRTGLQGALARIQEKNADAVFGPTIMVNSKGGFIQLFNQVVVPKIRDTHWCMPVQTCSLLYKKSCWDRFPYDASFRLAGDHHWFRKQMEMGLNIVGVKQAIGIFTWHPNRLAIGENDEPEDALEGIDKKAFRLKLAKKIYRFNKLWQGAYRRSPICYEIIRADKLETVIIKKPRLRVKRDLLE